MTGEATHLAFSDEHNWNAGRFRSIALVSLVGGDGIEVSRSFGRVIDERKVREVSWKDHGTPGSYQASIDFIRLAVQFAAQGRLRIDTLAWDIQDTRHQVRGRDDTENLGRMYYHLLKDVLGKRWPDESTWKLHPDRMDDMDWEELQWFLGYWSTDIVVEYLPKPLGSVHVPSIQELFHIDAIEPLRSSNAVLIQLADLFAALATFSREKWSEYSDWLDSIVPQQAFAFDNPDNVRQADKPSNRDLKRFPLLQVLDEECKRRKMGVSLKTKGHLYTFDPSNPINFWWYNPQTGLDKAPVRRR